MSVFSTTDSHINELKDAIRREHGCECEHAGSVPVRESFQGQTVWAGEVEVFELRGHPWAARCYARAHVDGNDGRAHRAIVLERPPVDSAQAAVKSVLLREVRAERRERGA